MSFQTPIPIKKALEEISGNRYVLPAIQREFVWEDEQICSLFDSLMQGFPIGSLLFWKLDEKTAKEFQFFGFVLDYHERKNPHCPRLGSLPIGPVTAILDGQQRLTALNIGLRGSLARRQRYGRWTSDWAFPEKRLYLNLDHDPDIDGDRAEKRYRFRFLTDDQARDASWFRVAKIFHIGKSYDVFDHIPDGVEDRKLAHRLLHELHETVHDKCVISFYEEETRDIEKVLEIFTRTNRGGTPLSYSDMLLSTATAQWKKLDARKEIHDLVDQLKQMDFGLQQDFVLKAGLMLADVDSVAFKVGNFSKPNMEKIENDWPAVKQTILKTVELVKSFGFSLQTLSSQSPLLPIAYWLHRCGPVSDQDRDSIRRWLIRSIVKAGIWGSGLDTLLTALRQVIRRSEGEFPVEQIERDMSARGKTLEFNDEEIEKISECEYHRAFGILTLLFNFVDVKHNQFHIDHIFPWARFHRSNLRKLGIDEDVIEDMQHKRNCLPNLQLLEGSANESKHAMLPSDWLACKFHDSDRENYARLHMLGNCGSDMQDFPDFYEARRGRLVKKLREILNTRQQN